MCTWARAGELPEPLTASSGETKSLLMGEILDTICIYMVETIFFIFGLAQEIEEIEEIEELEEMEEIEEIEEIEAI